MKNNEELETLIKIVAKRINFNDKHTSKRPKNSAEERTIAPINFLIEILKEFSKGGRKDALAKYFGLQSLNGILYDKKITAPHVINILMLMFNCKTPEELISKLVNFSMQNAKEEFLNKSDAEWLKLDDVLDEDEKMYLIYCGKKYKQLKQKRT